MAKSLYLVLAVILLLAVNSASATYYTYNSNTTEELYVGGRIHLPKSVADRLVVNGGGVIEKSTPKQWIIRATGERVSIEYVKLNDFGFSHNKKTFSAKEFPKELYNYMNKSEMRLTIKDLNNKVGNLSSKVNQIEKNTDAIADKPSFEDKVAGFLFFNPFMYIVYAVLAFFGFLAFLGSREY